MLEPESFIKSSGYIDFKCGHQGYLVCCLKDGSTDIHKAFTGNLNMTKLIQFDNGFDVSKCPECWFVEKNRN